MNASISPTHPTSIHPPLLLLLLLLLCSPPATARAQPVHLSILPPGTNAPDGLLSLRLHPTLPGSNYVLLGTESLAQPGWKIEDHLAGGEPGEFTDTTLALNGRSTLFLRAGSGEDSDGDGLPDAYEETITGTDPELYDGTENGAGDGYADPDGDGWSNLDEMENGTSPLSFDTPPPPSWLTIDPGPGPAAITIRWEPAPHPVLGYRIERRDPDIWNQYLVIAEVNANTTEFVFETMPEGGTGGDAGPYKPSLVTPRDYYRVSKVMPGGFSMTTPPLRPTDPIAPMPASTLFRGPVNRWYLHIGPFPPGVTTVRILRTTWDPITRQEMDAGTWDLQKETLIGGFLPLPEEMIWHDDGSSYLLGFVDSQNNVGELRYAQVVHAFESRTLFTPWLDGSAQIRENIGFLLRAATATEPIRYLAIWPGGYDQYNYRPDYVFAGFVQWGNPNQRHRISPFKPLMENHLWKNLVFDPQRLNPNTGLLSNGAVSSWDPVELNPPAILFDREVLSGQIPLPPQPTLLGDSEYLDIPPVGLSSSRAPAGYRITMADERRNLYGLPYKSTLIAALGPGQPIELQTLPAGQSVDIDRLWFNYYPEVERPEMVTVGYYFGVHHQEMVLRQGDPLPGEGGFSTDMPTPVIVVPVGDHTIVTAWARQRIVNGHPDKLAFAQLYFDSAWKADNLGFRTLEPSGFLAETGELFPTESGPLVLMTKPDPDNGGAPANVLVHAFNLEVDRNHDGTINPALGGPDTTTPGQRFEFWINNDNDGIGVGEDRHRPQLADSHDDRIRSFRDLEDFARLQISGLPNLPASEGYSVTLGWRHNFGPTINLFHALEPDGGTGYLDREEVAAAFIADPGADGGHIVRLKSETLYTFPDGFFTLGEKRHLLFEGVTEGSGGLQLTLWRHGKRLAHVAVEIELKKVRSMYGTAHIHGVNLAPPSSPAFSNPSLGRFTVDSSTPKRFTESRQIVVLIHGWRTSEHEFETMSNTYFKRLRLAGYRGRFETLRWPTPLWKNAGVLFPVTTFNRSEYVAFKSAPAARAYFANLASRYPGYSINVAAHSLGGILLMETLRLDAGHGVRLIDNCVFLQAAIPAHCFDPNHPNDPLLTIEAPPTPDTYRNYAAGIGNAVSGNIVNYYNPLDYALTTGTIVVPVNWEVNQKNYKPDTGFGYQTTETTAFHFTHRQLTDPHELMSFSARSRSRALGVDPVGGEIDLNLDLWQSFDFRQTAEDHHGQLHRPIQRMNGFFRSLRNDLGNGNPEPQ